MLARTARLHADRPAIKSAGILLTWGQFVGRIERAASLIHSRGVRPGDRYGIVARNSHQHAELIYAGYWIGAVPVPVNFRFAPPEIAYALDHANCSLVVVEEHFVEIFNTPELSGWADRLFVLPSAGVDPAGTDYEACLARASPLAMAGNSAPGDEALLLYTGGTTGRPKAVPLSHLNIVSNALQLAFEIAPRHDDVYLHVAPMFHSADLLATPFVLAGAAHVYMPSFSAAEVLETVQDHGVTVTLMTPTMLIRTLQEPDFERYDTTSLRQILYGSSPMDAQWIRTMMQQFECVEMVQAYGLTETSPILTVLPMRDHQKAIETNDDTMLRSVGRQIPGVDLKILDSAGCECEAGEAGEIVVRGPNVTAGYLNRPEATAEAFRDGWFHTGDIGCLDAQGYLSLLDRKKDIIITGSEIVYSSEVEAVLHQHLGVKECAVVGVPDEVYGEALFAVIVPMPGIRLDKDELVAHCRGRIGGFKIPRRYAFVDELPKSAIDKVLKTELRRVYSDKG